MYGFHDFSIGEEPGATDFDGIMRQTILTFDDATDRDTALAAVLEEGLVAQTLDDETFWRRTDDDTWEILFERLKGWTPEVVQGSAVAKTDDFAFYQRTFGRWDASFKVTFTGTGSPTEPITITPPFATIGIGGAFTFWDASLGIYRTGTIIPIDAGAIGLAINGAGDVFGTSAVDGITADDVLIIDMHGSY